ncbi:hypothetical protein HDU96_004312 [Phlyctochytrium bullatum]|nr:hypothetical protein HDU96_004312 [Phlyctochytrium bullatum]
MNMDQLASMPPEQLQLMLRLLKESRLLTEAETKKNEEIRKIRELELAAAAIQRQHAPHLGDNRQSYLPSPPASNGQNQGLDGLMPNKLPTATIQGSEFEELLRLMDLTDLGQALVESPPRAPLTPQSVLTPSPSFTSALLQSPHGNSLHHQPSFSTPVTPLNSFTPDVSSGFLEALNSDFSLMEPASTDQSPASTLNGATPLAQLQPDIAAVLAAMMLPTPETPMLAFKEGVKVREAVPAEHGSTSLATPPSQLLAKRSQLYPTLKEPWQPPPHDAPLTADFPDPSIDDNLPSLNTSRTSVRHRTRCRRCRTGICVFLLYGTTTPSQPPTPEDLAAAEDSVLCRACFEDGAASLAQIGGDDEEAGGATKIRKRRVKKVTQRTPLKCDACTREIGWGGMRMVDPGSSRDREGEWTEPPFGVEAVCDDCVNNFDFCTQCGGGGNFRTGKWRPRQLFLPGRRGCCHPHIRYGPLTDVQCMTFRCAPDGIPDIHFDPQPFVEKPNERTMKALLSQFHGRFPTSRELLELRMAEAIELYKLNKMGVNATAPVMARSLVLRTWREMALRIENGVKEVKAIVLGDDGTIGDLPPVGEVRRYFCTVDGLRSGKKPGRKQPSSLAETASDAQELCMTGFLVFQWDIPRRQIIHCHNAFVMREAEVDDPISHFSFCLASLLSRIEREARAERLPLPLHCGMWFLPYVGRGDLMAKLMAIGMVPLEEYVATLDEEERKVFARGVNLYGVGKEVKESLQYLFIGLEKLRMPAVQGEPFLA